MEEKYRNMKNKLNNRFPRERFDPDSMCNSV